MIYHFSHEHVTHELRSNLNSISHEVIIRQSQLSSLNMNIANRKDIKKVMADLFCSYILIENMHSTMNTKSCMLNHKITLMK